MEGVGRAVLRIVDLTKRFGPTVALAGVSLTVQAGEVQAIVGENGAGKSTLIKLLSGLYQPDAGLIELAGREVTLSSPRRARLLGINVIHQDRQLVPHLSGLENLYLGLPLPRRYGALVDWPAMRRRAATLQADLGMALPLHHLVRDYSPARCTMLEILRACLTESGVLLLDEPTASLTDHEVGVLFAIMGRLRQRGTALIYVSHRLDEVLTIADRITVLRNGRWVGQVAAASSTRDGLVALITGRDQAAAPHVTAVAVGPTLLEARGLSTRDRRVRDASLTLRAGEVVGLFGLAGAGRTELVEALYGLRPLAGGTITVHGQLQRKPSPPRALRAGMVLLPEDRRAKGLIMRRSVRENMTLQTLRRYTRGAFLSRRAELRAVRAGMEQFDVRAAGPGQPVALLSGGNQQKVLLARTLLANPRILLCDEPTHAVDVGTRALIHTLLRARADQGCAVLFVSSDLDEALAVADRLVLMGGGRTFAEARRGELTSQEVMRLCYEAEEHRTA